MNAQMKEVFARLQGLGIKPKYVKKVALPSWWEEDVAKTKAGFEETMLILARRLGLSFEALRSEGASLRSAEELVRFKADKDVEKHQLSVASAIAARLARLVFRGLKIDQHDDLGAVQDPVFVRAKILAGGAPWVGLKELVDLCWSVGIPVLHVTNLPTGNGVRKPAGMAVRVDGKYAIVLCRNDKAESKHLFNLAHELGHIARGHVCDEVLIDPEVDEASNDPQEKQANEYAIALLCGNKATRVSATDQLYPKKLGALAREAGTRLKIAPGHIVLNYGHTAAEKGASPWPICNKALQELDAGKALELLASRLAEHLDWDSFSDDDAEFICRMTGWTPPD